jgi:predicted nucleic acid-binding protein
MEGQRTGLDPTPSQEGKIPVIQLDTNVLVRLSVPGSGAAAQIRKWLLAGETLAVSAPVWYEYVSGPVSAQEIVHAEAILAGGILDFEKSDADKAADLFNAAGRKRSIKLDCMVAAAALRRGDSLATANAADFQPFAAQGLRINAVTI